MKDKSRMADRESKAKFVDDFLAVRSSYELFSQRLEQLLSSLLDANSIKFHVVESRTKTVESFREKIDRPGKSYGNPIKEISDLCGCRIIVFYMDDVDRASQLIKKEFKVLEEESSHRPEALDADRFGYLSMHFVVKMNRTRSRLAEWSGFGEFKAEIQVRTVIQHAWSAVSHALQYKQETIVPSRLKRRLHRIAGLFELADEEFLGLREQRSAMDAEAAESIAKGKTKIALNVSSLSQAIESWESLEKVQDIARNYGFMPSGGFGEMIEDILTLSKRVDISSVSDLIEAVSGDNHSIYEFLGDRSWYADHDFLFYLQLLTRYPTALNVQDFVDLGWGREAATTVLNAASRAAIDNS